MIDLKKISLSLIFTLSGYCAYGTDGIMDRSYALGQQPYEQLPICKAAIAQADGKIVVAGYSEMNGKKIFTVARLLQSGLLDQSFGKNGISQTVFTNGETASSAQAVMIDSKGKIVAAGFTNGIGNMCHACLARYNQDGSLDKSFFGGRGVFKGTVITTFGSIEGMSQINGLSETKDQKIVAVGARYQDKAVCFVVAKYNPTGSLDASFNAKASGSVSGYVCTQFDKSTHDEAFAVTLDPYEKILVAGSSYASGVKTFALARYHQDGSLDNSFFGGNTKMHGTVITNFMCGETEGAARAVCVQADGKIIVGGYTNAFSGGQNTTHFALARYSAQGVLDKTFGADNPDAIPGTRVTNFGTENACSAINALLIQPDGKIVAGGWAEYNKEKYFALARYENNGSCDYTFNGGGAPSGKVLSRSSTYNNDEIYGLTLVCPGDIIAVGRSKGKAVSYGAVSRYLCDIDLDSPHIMMPSNNDVIVNGSKVKIKGTGQDSSRVQVYLDDNLLDTICAKGSMQWEYNLPPLTSGEHFLQVVERYSSGNVILQSNKIKVVIDQHPKVTNQSIECHGMRNTQGTLCARGASGAYNFRITKETNCKVTLTDSSYCVKATIACGDASFEFEARDKETGCCSSGLVSIAVREIPLAGSVSLDMPQNQVLSAHLEAFTMGGQKPYSFEQVSECLDGVCQIKPEGIFSFAPEPEFLGATSFDFVATDSYNVPSEAGRVSIMVHPLPYAKECILHGYSGDAFSGQIAQQAVDGRKPYAFAVTSVQNHCSVTMEKDGSFICIPEADYVGDASFEYTIVDARGYVSKPCHVTICLHEKLHIAPVLIKSVKNKTIKKNLTEFISRGVLPYRFTLEKSTDDGIVTLDENGEFEFVPRPGFVGITECTVKVTDGNFYPGIEQRATIVISVQEMADFDTVTIDLYENEKIADLSKATGKLQGCTFSLIYAPQGLHVALSKNGQFSLSVDQEYRNQIEFMYQIIDETGAASDMKRALVVLHKLPVANSLQREVQIDQAILGNLKDYISEGIAPFTYRIISAKNGKIECSQDGEFKFKPRFDISQSAEFSFVVTDSKNNISNTATLEFHLSTNQTDAQIDIAQEDRKNAMDQMILKKILCSLQK
jgi:uncharacterized delta-60 repeat protein